MDDKQFAQSLVDKVRAADAQAQVRNMGERMSAEVLTERIRLAYSDLCGATCALADAVGVEAEVAFDLNLAQMGALREGTITGKNQAERDACMAGMFESETMTLETAKGVTAEAALDRDVARLMVEGLRLEVRVMELYGVRLLQNGEGE